MTISRLARLSTAIGACVALLFCSGALTAKAINTPSYWNYASTPLEVSGYNSTTRAYGYIKIQNGSNGTRLYSYAWHKFTDGDNHKAYLYHVPQFNAGTCRTSSWTVRYKGIDVGAGSSCAQALYRYGEFYQYGVNYTITSWTQMATQNAAVNLDADRGRSLVQACIDVPWRIDECSGVSASATDSF